MRRTAFAVTLAALLGLAGCASDGPPPAARTGSVPFDWDDEAPDRSALAEQPYYRLSESSSFLVKGASYARYVMKVEETVDAAEIFFTSTNRHAPDVRHPNVDAPTYHFEFMQLRALGDEIRGMDKSAQPAFRNASIGHSFTLTYIYGRGIDYQYLAPYEGDPGAWRMDPGFYELVIATDENLTVGVNVNLHTPLWTTYYHPQELGSARKVALDTFAQAYPTSPPRELRKELVGLAEAKAGEFLNYFVFSDLVHRANVAGLDAQGAVLIQVDSDSVPHRLDHSGVNGLTPHRSEAYAYAVSFGEVGPARHVLKTRLDFTQTLSLNSDLAARMLLFAVVLRPESTTPGVPEGDPDP